MRARKPVPADASAERYVVSKAVDAAYEKRLARDNPAVFAPAAGSSSGLHELARELGRVAAQAEMRRARRGSVAMLNHWIVGLLVISLAIAAIWTLIGS